MKKLLSIITGLALCASLHAQEREIQTTPYSRQLLTNANGAQLQSFFGVTTTPFLRPTQIIFEGDSITAGIGSTPYDKLLTNLYALNQLTSFRALAVAGSTLDTPGWQAGNDCWDRYTASVINTKPGTGTDSIFAVMIGINTLVNLSYNPTNFFLSLSNYWYGASTNGHKVLAITILPSGYCAGTNELNRRWINAQILSCPLPTWVFNSETALNDPASEDFSDTLHPSDRGNKKLAMALYQTITGPANTRPIIPAAPLGWQRLAGLTPVDDVSFASLAAGPLVASNGNPVANVVVAAPPSSTTPTYLSLDNPTAASADPLGLNTKISLAGARSGANRYGTYWGQAYTNGLQKMYMGYQWGSVAAPNYDPPFLTVDMNGNMGIYNAGPSWPLDIVGDTWHAVRISSVGATNPTLLRLEPSASTGDPLSLLAAVTMAGSKSGVNRYEMYFGVAFTNAVQRGYLGYRWGVPTNAMAYSTPAVTWTTDGNVGINNALPSAPLDVVGAAKFSSTLSAASFIGSGATLTNKVNTQAADYAITPSDGIILLAGAHAATLPGATTNAGKEFVVLCSSSGTNKISTVSSQTVNGQAGGYTNTAQYKYVRLVSDGANWWITGNN
jgi:hypothetical protein